MNFNARLLSSGLAVLVTYYCATAIREEAQRGIMTGEQATEEEARKLWTVLRSKDANRTEERHAAGIANPVCST